MDLILVTILDVKPKEMQQSDNLFIQQHLRSIIIHSLDTFNYGNAEFASERLLANDDSDLDLIYLYCLVLYRQKKYKTCFNKLADLKDHLGCSYLFGRLCLELKKYKEGIYQLLKVGYLYNDSILTFETFSSPGISKNGNGQPNGDNKNHYFSNPQLRYDYEQNRSIYPDLSSIYHLLGDLYKGSGDVKNSSLNYAYALKYNQFDFEAFQELCKLGVDAKVKSLFKPQQVNQLSFNDLDNSINEIAGTTTTNNNNNNNPASPFSTPHDNKPIMVHPDDTFNSLSTPRMKASAVPNAPLRKSAHHDSMSNRYEFTRPNFPNGKKKESSYSKITSRLISQPGSSTNNKTNTNNSNNTTSGGVNDNNTNNRHNGNLMASDYGQNGGSGERRMGIKRNNSGANINQEPHQFNFIPHKDIENSNNYLLQLYVVFAKSFKCISKYDCYKAIRILETLPENQKETPWVLSKLGKLHYEIVNYKQSENFFIKLRKLDRTRLEDMEYYSTLLWHLHKKVELTYLANELHDLDNKSPIAWCVIGNLFSLTREPDEAIKCFNKSIKLNENFTYAYTLKGHEYFGNDNYEMALENFRIGLLIDPRHYNALYGIGMVYINLGDYQKADYHFRKAVSINPVNIILICCVGMVLEKLGKKNLALRQYELANKLQPLNPLPIFKKAQLLFSTQQFQSALQLFEKLKDLAPDEASVHFLLGQLYNIQNDKFKAIKEFTIALNLDPKGNYLIREAMESLQDK